MRSTEAPPAVARTPDDDVVMSNAAVALIERCGELARRRLVERESPGPKGATQLFGDALHEAVDVWQRDHQHADEGVMVRDVWRPTWLRTLRGHGIDEGAALPDSAHDGRWWMRRGEQVMVNFYRRWDSSGWEITSTEQAFTVDIAGVPTRGSIDIVAVSATGDVTLVDNKSGKPPHNPADAVVDMLQLRLYVLAYEQLTGRRPDAVAVDWMLDGLFVAVPVDALDLDDAVTRLRRAYQRRLAGDLPATPGTVCATCPLNRPGDDACQWATVSPRETRADDKFAAMTVP